MPKVMGLIDADFTTIDGIKNVNINDAYKLVMKKAYLELLQTKITEKLKKL
jgi:hypothetical protein